MMSAEEKRTVERRLKRVAGQVAGIQRMVDEDRYCVDVLMQISAVRAALSKVSGLMLESHMKTCVTGAFYGKDDDRETKIAELIEVFDRSCSC